MGQPVVHFEIWGPNGDKLQNFYKKNFGWKIDAKNPMKYGLTDTRSNNKGINGGISDTPPNAPKSGTTMYIEVNRIDPYLRKIQKAGGKVVTPRTVIPGMVTFAQFVDPAGNLLGLVESTMAPVETVSAKPARTSKKRAARAKTSRATSSKKKSSRKTR